MATKKPETTVQTVVSAIADDVTRAFAWFAKTEKEAAEVILSVTSDMPHVTVSGVQLYKHPATISNGVRMHYEGSITDSECQKIMVALGAVDFQPVCDKITDKRNVIFWTRKSKIKK